MQYDGLRSFPPFGAKEFNKARCLFPEKNMLEEFTGWFRTLICERHANNLQDPESAMNSHNVQNSGICAPGPDGEMSYGQLQEILEFKYLSFKVALFRVKWFDTRNNGRVKKLTFRNGMTQIIGSGEWWKNDQYILATTRLTSLYLEIPTIPNVKVSNMRAYVARATDGWDGGVRSCHVHLLTSFGCAGLLQSSEVKFPGLLKESESPIWARESRQENPGKDPEPKNDVGNPRGTIRDRHVLSSHKSTLTVYSKIQSSNPDDRMRELEATGEHTTAEINAMVRGGKLRGHIPGVGPVMPGYVRSRLSYTAPVDRSRDVDFMMNLMRSDNSSRMLCYL
ncbi:hypothetical protein Tco_1502655 [Tanacetum coccineum]